MLCTMRETPDSQTSRRLPRYVGVKEVCSALGISKPTLDRLRRDGKFPLHEQLSPNRVGWRMEVIEQHLAIQAGSLDRLSVTNPDDLSEDELHDQARTLAATAHSKRTGRQVDPQKLDLHLTEKLNPEVFAALELEEHRTRAAYLSELPVDNAMLIVWALLPQLQDHLAKVASSDLRQALNGPDPIDIDFAHISGFLRLFELQTRLAEIGIREPTHQTVLEQLSEFEPGRAFIVAAWLFPALRPAFAAGAETSFYRELFADQEQLRGLAVLALNDDEWAEIESDLLMRQRALETPPQVTPPAAKRSRRREREHLADTGQLK